MKAKQNSSLARSAKKSVAVAVKKRTTKAAKKKATSLTKPKTVAHAKNGAAALPRISSPVKKGKAGEAENLRATPATAAEIERRAKLKAYFDSLDEETHIREFKKLPLKDMFFLAWAYTYEDAQQGKRLA